MAVGKNFGNSPGPKPGNTRAIPQRKAIAEGFVAEAGPCNTETFQKYTETGTVHAPNLSRWGKK